jgi:chorismate mutase
MTIDDCRAEIDSIDSDLLRLLNRRAALALKIGILKHGRGLEICDPQREREVIDRVCQANEGPLSHSAVERIFRRIVREARAAEMNEIVSGESATSERIAR